jgi:hypothetical protein
MTAAPSAPANRQALPITVEFEGDGITPSSIMRWWVSDAVKQELVDRTVKSPFLLVVVTHGTQEMERYLFPLFDGRRGIRFYRPRTNRIHLEIVWVNADGRKTAKQAVFGKQRDGSYTQTLVHPGPPEGIDEVNRRISRLREELDTVTNELREITTRWSNQQAGHLEFELGDESDETSSPERTPLQNEPGYQDLAAREAALRDQLSAAAGERLQLEDHGYRSTEFVSYLDDISRLRSASRSVTVDVPDGMFGRNHPLVTKISRLYPWWRTPGKDECHIRQRFWATLFTGWLLVPLGLLLATIAVVFDIMVLLVLLLQTRRGISLEPLRHPLMIPPDEAWKHIRPSVWTHRQVPYTYDGTEDYHYLPRKGIVWLKLFTPLRLLAALLLVTLVWRNLGHTQGSGGVSPALIITLALCCVGMFLVILAVAKSSDPAHQRAQAKNEEKAKEHAQEQARHRAQARLATALDAVTLPTTVAADPEADLAELPPPGHFTLHYGYEALKARFCKPFARL